MKAPILFFALLLSAQMAVAQSADSLQMRPRPEGRKSGHRRMFTVADANKMMVAQLGLNEKQQKKVEKLNKKYAGIIEGTKPKMASGGQGFSQGGPGGRGGFGGGGFGGDMGDRPSGGFGDGSMGGGRGGFGGGRPGGMGHGGSMGMPQDMQGSSTTAEDLDAKQAKYDKKLRKILTEAQYDGYLRIKPQFYAQRKNREFLMGGQPSLEAPQGSAPQE